MCPNLPTEYSDHVCIQSEACSSTLSGWKPIAGSLILEAVLDMPVMVRLYARDTSGWTRFRLQHKQVPHGSQARSVASSHTQRVHTLVGTGWNRKPFDGETYFLGAPSYLSRGLWRTRGFGHQSANVLVGFSSETSACISQCIILLTDLQAENIMIRRTAMGRIQTACGPLVTAKSKAAFDSKCRFYAEGARPEISAAMQFGR